MAVPRNEQRRPSLASHAVALSSLFLFAWTPLSGQVADLGQARAHIGEEIERALRETATPAIAVALVADGAVAWTEAFGHANVATATRATSSTYFSTGSTFKFVTATAVMQLVERGTLGLDDSLNEFLGPELAIQSADDVTFRHLLSHHSGLRGSIATVPLWSRLAPASPSELIRGLVRHGPPGETFEYCNACYGILAWVIQEATGQTYDEYIAEHVLRPLGVDLAAPSIPSAVVVESLALPYAVGEDGAVPVSQVRFDGYAAGDAYLRAGDMGRFLAAHVNGGSFQGVSILEERSVLEMQRVQFGPHAYGLGTQVVEIDGRKLLYHSGSIPGFSSFFIADPVNRVGIYLMSNSGEATSILAALAQFAIPLLRGEEPGPLPSFAGG